MAFKMRHAKAQGFSLIEMAVVLMIMGILMSGVLVSISQTTLSARRASALAQLRQVEEALYGFAESQGRLPCPASATTMGLEDGSAGSCNLTHGFVPSATLGIYGQINGSGLLLDPWSNPLRYSLVKTATYTVPTAPGNPDFSNSSLSTSSISDFFKNSRTFATDHMFKICDDSMCAGTTLTNTAAAVIMTMGENWASYSPTTSSQNERTNAGMTTLGIYPVHDSSASDSDRIFVSTDYSEQNFDDQIVWLSPYVLFNRMVSAGKLP